MMIREISDYIKENKQVPLRDLAYHFKLEESIASDMLQRLVEKGRIRELDSGTPCSGGCTQCSPQTVRIFVWNN